jgi:hypothetical protein
LEFSEALPNVKRFTSWAFGPDGLPGLEILAYGDFSFRDRQPNVSMCRSGDEANDAHSSNMPSSPASSGPRPRNATPNTLVRTFTEFLNVLEESINSELIHLSTLFALFELINHQFLNL